jgi:hypothetical protein
MMSGTVILAVVLAVIVVAVAAALLTGVVPGRRGGTGGGRELRRRFGPEYDLLAEQHGDPKAAEQELAERVREHDALTLRPLAQDERVRYVQTWTSVQERFVDDPRGAAQQADQMIGGLLTAIGYPSADRDRQLALASVDHAHALSDYRQARDLMQRAAASNGHGDGDRAVEVGARDGGDGGDDAGKAAADSTELLRQAILHYRVMFKDLLGSSSPATERAHAVR